jgi:hypothetical protein
MLAMLESKIDRTKAIVVGTDQIIDLTNMDFNEYRTKISNGEWSYYEEYLPRRMLISNPNWKVLSFEPKTRFVCVEITSTKGTRLLNFTLPELYPSLTK